MLEAPWRSVPHSSAAFSEDRSGLLLQVAALSSGMIVEMWWGHLDLASFNWPLRSYLIISASSGI